MKNIYYLMFLFMASCQKIPATKTIATVKHVYRDTNGNHIKSKFETETNSFGYIYYYAGESGSQFDLEISP